MMSQFMVDPIGAKNKRIVFLYSVNRGIWVAIALI